MPLAAPDPFAEDLAVTLYDLDPDLARGVETELRRGWEMDKVMARLRQEQIGAETAATDHAAVDGLGELTMQIDSTAYFYWAGRLGHQCWEDRQFRREFLRDNPAARVRNVPRHTTISKCRVLLTDRRGAVLPT